MQEDIGTQAHVRIANLTRKRVARCRLEVDIGPALTVKGQKIDRREQHGYAED